MLREEAITILKAFMENPLFSDEHKSAFNIAIHDIKQRHDWDINNLILINKENYEPQSFKWCTDCREYDQEKHCCHRWGKVIRNTVEEMKQEYIEREVLDKLRAELHATAEMHEDGGYYIRAEWINECFDKYKGETENP